MYYRSVACQSRLQGRSRNQGEGRHIKSNLHASGLLGMQLDVRYTLVLTTHASQGTREPYGQEAGCSMWLQSRTVQELRDKAVEVGYEMDSSKITKQVLVDLILAKGGDAFVNRVCSRFAVVG